MIRAGDPAPEFELESCNGETVRLRDHRGGRVVLYFYPRDDTPGCTKQACSFRDSRTEWEEAGITVLGVSPDSPESHRKFRDKHRLETQSIERRHRT